METDLHDAARNGQEDMCRLILDSGEHDVNATNQEEETPLILASQAGHVKVCELLLGRGATHAPQRDGWTPLHLAAENGHEEICELLLSRGAAQTAQRGLWTPLHLAANNRHARVCSLLLDRGADVAAQDRYGWTPLHSAASTADNAEVCEMLLRRGAPIDMMDEDGVTPLFLATINGLVDVCEVLLRKGADPKIRSLADETPLYAAAADGHLQVCDLLLQHDPDGLGHLHVYSAPFPNEPDELAVLSTRRDTPLHAAAKYGHVKTCELLLDRGAKVDVISGVGVTPLYTAAVRGEAEVCAMLLNRQPATNRPDPALYPGKSFLAQLDIKILAMLAQRAPRIFDHMSWMEIIPKKFDEVSKLIFAVHAFLPSMPRRIVIEIIIREVVTKTEEQMRTTSVEVFEVLSVFSPVFDQQPRRLYPAAEAAVRRGTLARKLRERLPWWVWGRTLIARYGVPEAWTRDAFWDGQSVPCEEPVRFVFS